MLYYIEEYLIINKNLMAGKGEYKNILEIIEAENENILKKYYFDKNIKYIGFTEKKDKSTRIVLKNEGTYYLVKNSIRQFLKHGREFFRNGRKGTNALSSGKAMAKEDKEFFGYNLNNIDYKKMESLNKDEMKFIVDNLLNVSRDSLTMIDNLQVNFSGLGFSKKEKKIRNRSLIENNLLKNTLVKYSTEYTKSSLSERQKILKEKFQSWIIDEIRSLSKERVVRGESAIQIPDITNIETNNEMEAVITKNIFKQL